MEIIMSSNQQPPKLDLDETELRLGLPGGGVKEAEGVVVAAVTNNKNPNANGKRGFEETVVDLKLSLSSNNKLMMENSAIDSSHMINNIIKEECNNLSGDIDQVKPPAKAQVVGWPPVRKNMFASKQKSKRSSMKEEGGGGAGLVKVSIDGAPYLRKVDLKMFKSYQQLSDGLGKMFNSFTTGKYEAKGMIDFMNENKLMDLLNSSDFVPTYEDKDGDWMLVGDVPWGMFVESCKRLRVMKGSDAAGLAPRAMEKCKNRS